MEDQKIGPWNTDTKKSLSELIRKWDQQELINCLNYKGSLQISSLEAWWIVMGRDKFAGEGGREIILDIGQLGCL